MHPLLLDPLSDSGVAALTVDPLQGYSGSDVARGSGGSDSMGFFGTVSW